VWLSFSRQEKLVYVAGVFDGMRSSSNFVLGFCGDCEGVDRGMNWFLQSSTEPQIAADLDALYRDHRNRSIYLAAAFEVVLASRRGFSAADTAATIRRLRAESNR
jgi:hypothetical protein